MVTDPPAATILATKAPVPAENTAAENSPPSGPRSNTPEAPSPQALSPARDLSLDEAIDKLDPSLKKSLEADFRAQFTGVFQLPAPERTEQITPPRTDNGLVDPDEDRENDEP